MLKRAKVSGMSISDSIKAFFLNFRQFSNSFCILLNSWWRCRESNPGPKYFQYNVIHKVSWLFELQQTHSTHHQVCPMGLTWKKPNDRLLPFRGSFDGTSLWLIRLLSFPMITPLGRNQTQRYRWRLNFECFMLCLHSSQPCTLYFQYSVDTSSPP